MPKRHPSQHKGGRSSDGSPAKSSNPKRNAGHALSAEVIAAIDALPQVQSGEWSKSYLAEQLWRNFLKMPADYDWGDLDLVAIHHIIE
jgi:hypothetical protein